jgi:hypothetical protein
MVSAFSQSATAGAVQTSYIIACRTKTLEMPGIRTDLAFATVDLDLIRAPGFGRRGPICPQGPQPLHANALVWSNRGEV